jgi:hypothetical protein
MFSCYGLAFTIHTRQYTLTVLCNQGVGAVVGALSRNLAELQERQGSYLSIYDQPSSALKVYLPCKLLM